MGVTAFRDAADAELLAFGPRWGDIGVPENWNIGCMQLVLGADADLGDRLAAQRILTNQDRLVLRTLLEYKLLEGYLGSPVGAKITWQPDKNKVAAGPVVTCRECKFPRSVTAMAADGLCGMCSAASLKCPCVACADPKNPQERLCANVTREHTESSTVPWVECSVRDCRAQYVVYNPGSLRVRPKCFYCRHAGDGRMAKAVGKAPLVECARCLGRMIWPHEYRPRGFDEGAFMCPGCTSGVQTVVVEEVTPREMEDENGLGWLLENTDQAIEHPFNGRSIFHTASHCDLETLAAKVQVLPSCGQTIKIRGKPVQNAAEIKDHIRLRITNRESNLTSCSLCFSDLDASRLGSACGRSGCKQRICADCIKSWYGLNKAGCIINTAALSCPFCRRLPAGKIARRHRLTEIGSLAKALDESGTWIHGWCWRCNHAKPYMERVCANGAPEPVHRWFCEGCQPLWDVKTAKECPGCGVLTEKTFGCHHMTCPCGEHWCWGCGEAHPASSIYRHIGDKHGGLQMDWDYESEYDYDTADED
jgi:hypothetical protein